jgi:hypothetical protein
MQELEKYYQYAEECRRIAERAKDKDRAALLENCGSLGKTGELPNSASDEIISSPSCYFDVIWRSHA